MFHCIALCVSVLEALGHACATLSILVAAISEIYRKEYPLVEQTLSGKVLQVSSMACFQLTPQYILLGVAEALVTPACKSSPLPRDTRNRGEGGGGGCQNRHI